MLKAVLILGLSVIGAAAEDNTGGFVMPILAMAPVEGGDGIVKGHVEFRQHSLDGPVSIKLQFNGLKPGLHALHVHEFAVKNGDCLSAGAHFNPDGHTHHGRTDYSTRHLGDLGNIQANEMGEINFDLSDSLLKLHGSRSIIGKSYVVHADKDDNGLGGNTESEKTGNAGGRIACGTIKLVNEL